MIGVRRPKFWKFDLRRQLPPPRDIVLAFILALLSGGPIVGFITGCIFDCVGLWQEFHNSVLHPHTLFHHGFGMDGAEIAGACFLPIIGFFVGLVSNILHLREAIPFAVIIVAIQVVIGPSRRLSALTGGLYGVAFGVLGINPEWATNSGLPMFPPPPHTPPHISHIVSASILGIVGVIVGVCLPPPCLMRAEHQAKLGLR